MKVPGEAAVTPPNPADGRGTDRSQPDPTLLTIDALRREIAMLGNRVDASIESAERLDDERFRSIDMQLQRGEELRREQKADTKAAVDAALQAQQDATHKMESSVSTQIASLRGNVETEVRSIRSTLADVKERMTQLESRMQGQSEQKTERREVTAGTVAIIGGAATVILAVLAVIAFAISGAG